jgi:hypothetical protein
MILRSSGPTLRPPEAAVAVNGEGPILPGGRPSGLPAGKVTKAVPSKLTELPPVTSPPMTVAWTFIRAGIRQPKCPCRR